MTTAPIASALLLLLAVASTTVSGQTSPIETIDIQKECPVMVGNKIDPNLFTVYQGKKVYFCCSSCKESFDAQPDKYLSRLPQFAASIAPIVADGGTPPTLPAQKVSNKSAGKTLIVPLGIAAFITIVATVLTGLYRRLRPRLMFRLHKILGIAALIIAACHAAIVILLV